MKQRTYKATGINLKAMAMGESDRLVTVLTKEHGLVRAIAPGARKHKSRLGGRSGLFVINECLFTRGKSLDKLVQAETVRSFPGLSKNLAKLTASQYLAEIALSQALADQPQTELYYLLVEHLTRLEAAAQPNILPCLAQATFHLLALAGVAPEVFRCSLTRSPLDIDLGNPDWRAGFSVSSGGAIALGEIEKMERDRLIQIERLEADRLARAGQFSPDTTPLYSPVQGGLSEESARESEGSYGPGQKVDQKTGRTAHPASGAPTGSPSIGSPSSGSPSISSNGHHRQLPRPTFINPNRSYSGGPNTGIRAMVSKEIARDLGLVGYLSAAELALMQQLSKPALVMSTSLNTVFKVSSNTSDGFGADNATYGRSHRSAQSGTIGANGSSLSESGPHLMWRHIEKFLRHYAQYQLDRPIRSADLIDTCFST